MPRSLNQGPSKIVPVKMPDEEKQAALAACKEGETLSGFIRLATSLLVKRRNKEKQKPAKAE